MEQILTALAALLFGLGFAILGGGLLGGAMAMNPGVEGLKEYEHLCKRCFQTAVIIWVISGACLIAIRVFA